MDEPKFVLKERYLCLHGFSLQSSTLTWTARHLSRSYLFYCQKIAAWKSILNNIFRKLFHSSKRFRSHRHVPLDKIPSASKRRFQKLGKGDRCATDKLLSHSSVCLAEGCVGGADGYAQPKQNWEPQIWTHSCHWFKSLQRHSRLSQVHPKREQKTTPFALYLGCNFSIKQHFLDRHVQKFRGKFSHHPWHFTLSPFPMSHRGT